MSETAVHPNGVAKVSKRVAREDGRSFKLFFVLVPGAALVLLLVGTLSMPDESRPVRAAALSARWQQLRERGATRWQQLHERLHEVTSRRLRLRAERLHEVQRRMEHEAREARERRLNERVVWNGTSGTWDAVSTNGTGAAANGTAAAAAAATAAAAAAAAAASPPPSMAAAAAARRDKLLPTRRAAISLPSPPPPLGPPVLLRAGQEGGCLHYTESLELLARGACDFDVKEQRFVWEPASRTLRYASDTTQCVDYFVGLQDFGVWSCFDAGNDEFFVREASIGRYCLQLDHDKCVHAVGATKPGGPGGGEKKKPQPPNGASGASAAQLAAAHSEAPGSEAVLLRVPGEASCLQLDSAGQPLSHHTCDDSAGAQRWRFDPPFAAFRAAHEPSLCLDYQLEAQAWTVWQCPASAAEAARGDGGFVYHRYTEKYCLRRGSGSTCVQVAAGGSSLMLRRATFTTATCLRHAGRQRRATAVECDANDIAQRWVWHSATGTFRVATDAGVCLDLFQTEDTSAALGTFGANDGFGGNGHDGGAAEDRHLATLDGGGALGSWPCVARAPNERFAFDRYMSRYCVSSRPSVCVMEAILGTPLRLREPGGTLCLHFDGGLTALQLKTCNATEPKQHWAYDAATLVFRHAADSRRCIDFFVAHGAFGVWKCRDGIEINSQQQFRYDEQRDRFCLLSDPEQCLQEATSALLY
jgi:hypothetical protein